MRRIDILDDVAPRYDGAAPINPNPFINSPGEFLCKHIAIELRKVSQFADFFSDFIDAYPRDDYAFRNLPALRVFSEDYTKEHETWYIKGDIIVDVVLPASLRRIDNQEIPDIITTALMQQFRRPTFFTTLCDLVPGLNELGKRYNVNKAMAFQFSEKEFVPMARCTLNFRIDLAEWDRYLISDDRTVDSPFEKTLGDLERLTGDIEGLRDNDDVDVTIGYDDDLTD